MLLLQVLFLLSVCSVSYSALGKKVVILTGANSGIGFAAAKLLTSRNDYQVIFACRSEEKARNAINSLPALQRQNAEYMNLDLSDLDSVREFSKQYLNTNRPLHCLALNAGIQTGPKKEATFTKQGYEMTIGTNHLGHFALLQQLLPSLQRSSKVDKEPARIVVTASGGNAKHFCF
jgi:NAD(P)-dependent dehydrogenase (short-subunit alcohol dehydrogenase family)